MYFPQIPIEIRDFLRNVDSYSDEQKLCVIENFVRQLKCLPFPMQIASYCEIGRILDEYKEILTRRQRGDDVNSEEELIELEGYLKEKLRNILVSKEPRIDGCSMVVSDVKPYKGLYIFILSHPQNNSNEIAEILSRVNYLDKMTRNVTFVMPGYKRASETDEVCNAADHNLQLTFDENVLTSSLFCAIT